MIELRKVFLENQLLPPPNTRRASQPKGWLIFNDFPFGIKGKKSLKIMLFEFSKQVQS